MILTNLVFSLLLIMKLVDRNMKDQLNKILSVISIYLLVI